MAQKWRMVARPPSDRTVRRAFPLNEERLQALALRYVERYATTRRKLILYLERKLRERGWDSENPADVDGLTSRLAQMRYVDDSAYARMKGSAMTRRGMGPRRVRDGLRAAGVEEADRGEAEAEARSQAWQAANTLARKRGLGPYARQKPDEATRKKGLAIFLRFGHDFEAARQWVDCAPGEWPEGEDE